MNTGAKYTIQKCNEFTSYCSHLSSHEPFHFSLVQSLCTCLRTSVDFGLILFVCHALRRVCIPFHAASISAHHAIVIISRLACNAQIRGETTATQILCSQTTPYLYVCRYECKYHLVFCLVSVYIMYIRRCTPVSSRL